MQDNYEKVKKLGDEIFDKIVSSGMNKREIELIGSCIWAAIFSTQRKLKEEEIDEAVDSELKKLGKLTKDVYRITNGQN